MKENEKPLSTRDIAEGADRADRERVEQENRRMVQTQVEPHAGPGEERPYAALFEDDEARGFRSRWEGIQTGFVDEPRAAVEQADALVAQLMKRLAEVFSDERASLEQQWDRGDQISTEDLRVALKRYRSFFERLLSL
jgi:hypothetical protein